MQKQAYVNRVAAAREKASANPTPEMLRALGTALFAFGDYAAKMERDYEQSVAAFEEACSIFHNIGDSKNLAKGYFNLGVAYEIGFRKYEIATRYVEKAIELTQSPRLRAYYERELSCLAVSRFKQGRI